MLTALSTDEYDREHSVAAMLSFDTIAHWRGEVDSHPPFVNLVQFRHQADGANMQ